MTESNSIPVQDTDPPPPPLSLSPSIYRYLFSTLLIQANYLNMDLDKPLDEMISAKKRSTPNTNTNNNANAKPRQSRERRDVPYAVRIHIRRYHMDLIT